MLNTRHRASDTPGDSADDVRFDYELRDPFSIYGVAAIVVAVVLLPLVIGLVIHLL
jgi:hypothetical protein